MQSIRAFTTALVLGSLASAGVSAQTPMQHGAGKGHDMKSMSKSGMADGEVRRVDKEAGKVTLKHGPIKTDTLDMEPMTMVFQVKDKAMLDVIKDGDKVKFRAVADEGGRMTITEIKPAR